MKTTLLKISALVLLLTAVSSPILAFSVQPTPIAIDSFVKCKTLKDVRKFLSEKYIARKVYTHYEEDGDRFIRTEMLGGVSFYGCLGALKVDSWDSSYSCEFALAFDKTYWFDWWKEDLKLRNYFSEITEPTTKKAQQIKDSLIKYFGTPTSQKVERQADVSASWYTEDLYLSLFYWDEHGIFTIYTQNNNNSLYYSPPDVEPLNIDSLIHFKEIGSANAYLMKRSVKQEVWSGHDSTIYTYWGVRINGNVGWITVESVGKDFRYVFKLPSNKDTALLRLYPYLTIASPRRAKEIKDSLYYLGLPLSHMDRHEDDPPSYYQKFVWYKDSSQITLNSDCSPNRRFFKLTIERSARPQQELTLMELIDSILTIRSTAKLHTFLGKQKGNNNFPRVTTAGKTEVVYRFNQVYQTLETITIPVDTNNTSFMIEFHSHTFSHLNNSTEWLPSDTIDFQLYGDILAVVEKRYGKPKCIDTVLPLPGTDKDGGYIKKHGRIFTCTWKRGKLQMTTTGALQLIWDFKRKE